MTTATAPRPSAARERLLATASRLFYAEGIHGVGVDRILTEAGVTRATMYRHFTGKEDLVLAYVRGVDAGVRGDLAAALAGASSPRAVLRALAGVLGETICGPGFRGCAFINAAAEHPDPADPVHRAVLEHRAWFARTVVEALAAAGHPDPAAAGQRLLVLRDGAMVAGYLGDPGAARALLARAVDDALAEASGAAAGEADDEG